MNKKEIYHLLKRYRYIVEAVQKGESDVEIRISGRREYIKIDTKILTFVEIVQIIYNNVSDTRIKKFMDMTIMRGKPNTRAYSMEPLDKSTYYRYKSRFVDILYHCCIYKKLVTMEEILAEKIV